MGKITFKEISIDDAPFFKKHIENSNFNCDWAFTNIFCWQSFYNVEWNFILEHIVIHLNINGNDTDGYMISPIDSSDSTKELIEQLSENAKSKGQILRIVSLSNEEKKILQSFNDFDISFDNNRDYEDYIYNTSDLRTLKGSKYAAKRNHINKFSTLYKYEYRPLTPDLFDECLRLEAIWKKKHSEHKIETSAEQNAIKLAFSNFDKLGLVGGALYVNNKLIAFTYGSEINEHTFCTHIEKADISYEGVFSMINYLFVNKLPDKYQYINREDDMGLEGLRKSKLSYHPFSMEPKFAVLFHDETTHSIINTWTECFDDDEDYVFTFLTRYYTPNISFFKKVDNKIVSMLFIILFHSEIGNVAYLFGVSTLDKYRNRGYAKELIEKAIESCRKNKIDNMILIPGNEELKKLYKKFDFKDSKLPVQFISDFDFGTGNPNKNLAMTLSLSNKKTIFPEILYCYYSD